MVDVVNHGVLVHGLAQRTRDAVALAGHCHSRAGAHAGSHALRMGHCVGSAVVPHQSIYHSLRVVFDVAIFCELSLKFSYLKVNHLCMLMCCSSMASGNFARCQAFGCTC